MALDVGSLALFVGFLSAVSLPIGSVVGFTLRPRAKITSALMAFGGGALLFALTLEIIAHSFHIVGFWPVASGCIIGGILYEFLNHGLNGLGAFFRKGATVIRRLRNLKMKKAEQILEHLSHVPLLESLPPEEIVKLVPRIEERVFAENTYIFRENEPAWAFYIIDSGTVEITKGDMVIAKGRAGDTFGEMALLTDEPRVATAIARGKSVLFRISKKDFNELLMDTPALKQAVEALLVKRDADLAKQSVVPAKTARKWREQAVSSLESKNFLPTALDINKAAKASGHVSFGIWLGILLDGIPESFVIGIVVAEIKSVPWALIAAVFLANFAEAMSSSVVMISQEYSRMKIILMWSSITIITALGAFLGSIFLGGVSAAAIGIIEGVAAGAMLTMISETMLPEAFEQGGAVVGLSTLAGFLAALLVKSITQ